MKTRKRRTGMRWLAVIVMALALMLSGSQSVFPQEGPPKKYPLGDIPLSKGKYVQSMKLWSLDWALEGLDAAYNAMDDGIVTPAKDQGGCGSCWAFATTGAMESHLAKTFGIGLTDLSEQQQVSCNSDQAGCCGGSSDAPLFWENTGPILESCFGYGDGGTSCPVRSVLSCSASDGCTEMDYRVTDWHTVSATPSGFKTSLYTNGPSYWRYDVYDDFFGYWNKDAPGEVYVQQSGGLAGGHAVLLIGWDDSKGAYLCKNSWGENGGPNGNGTFWIAYTGHAQDLRFGMSNFSVEPYVPDPCDACWKGVCDGSCNPKKEGPDCPDCVSGCISDAECDDGLWCTGTESCVGGTCQDGTPVDCPVGTVCDEATLGCIEEDNCDACFKGVCDGVCHPTKDGSDCPDCQ